MRNIETRMPHTRIPAPQPGDIPVASIGTEGMKLIADGYRKRQESEATESVASIDNQDGHQLRITCRQENGGWTIHFDPGIKSTDPNAHIPF